MKRLLIGMMLAAASVPACFQSYHVLTPAELEQRGTRTYRDLAVDNAVTAASNALRVLGFEVVVADVATRTIKTGPHKIMLINATAEEQATTRDEIVWVLRFDDGPGGAIVVHAQLRGFHNGEEVGPDRIVAEVVDPQFAALWREVDAEIARLHGTAATR
nr:hypothetical protein [Kofleriaceae bacterium]